MGKIQYFVKSIATKKDKRGRNIDVVQTVAREKTNPCKVCKKEPRLIGSSRCAKCKSDGVARRMNDSRLQAKIKQASA